MILKPEIKKRNNIAFVDSGKTYMTYTCTNRLLNKTQIRILDFECSQSFLYNYAGDYTQANSHVQRNHTNLL